MKLWPFSKKPQESLSTSDEFPPGVMLAAPEESDFTNLTHEAHEEPQAVHSGSSQPTLHVVPSPAAPNANSHLLDAFTPPASPEVGPWPTPQESIANAPMPTEHTENETTSFTEETSFQFNDTTSFTDFDNATDTSWNFEESQGNIDVTPISDSFDVAIGLPEELASDIYDVIEEPPQPQLLSETPMAFDNIVPFPIKSLETEEVAASYLGPIETTDSEYSVEITPVISWQEPQVESLLPCTENSTSVKPVEFAIAPEEASVEGDYSAFAVPSTDLDFEWTSPAAEAESVTPTPADAPFYSTEISLETSFYESMPDEDLSHYTPLAASLNTVDMRSPVEESLLSLEDSRSFVENTVADADSDFMLEEIPVTSIEVDELCDTEPLPMDFDSYDFGHYDDPEEPNTAFTLDEVIREVVTQDEPLESQELMFQPQILDQSLAEDKPTEDSPMPIVDTHEVADLYNTLAAQNAQTDQDDSPVVMASVSQQQVPQDFKKSVPSVTGAMHNFAQQVILEESHHIKRSIDDLVARYFNGQNA